MSIKTQRLLSRAKKLITKGEINAAKQIYIGIIESHPLNKEAKIGLVELNQIKEVKPYKSQLED